MFFINAILFSAGGISTKVATVTPTKKVPASAMRRLASANTRRIGKMLTIELTKGERLSIIIVVFSQICCCIVQHKLFTYNSRDIQINPKHTITASYHPSLLVKNIFAV